MTGSRDRAQINWPEHMPGRQDQFCFDNVFSQRSDIGPGGNAGPDPNCGRLADGVDQAAALVKRFRIFDRDHGIKAGRHRVACIQVAGLGRDLKRDWLGWQRVRRIGCPDSKSVHCGGVIIRRRSFGPNRFGQGASQCVFIQRDRLDIQHTP